MSTSAKPTRLSRLFGLAGKRRRAAARATPGAMRDFLLAPTPDACAPLSQIDIVSLDLETTGLNPRRDVILSHGLVTLRDDTIDLASARHEIIRISRQIPEASAVIHGITDDQAASGRPLEIILPELLAQLAGKVMLVHFARVEQRFLDAACRRLYGAPFLTPTIDTLLLAERLFSLRNHSIQPTDLRLFNLRPRYNLPRYQAHNALSDALATAELFLALAAEIQPNPDKRRLGAFISNH